MTELHALILANGKLGDGEVALEHIRRAQLIICADGGMHHARALGVRPDVVIGDLDSLPADARDELEQAGAEVLAFPARKDETDLELALLYAVNRGATQIVVLGALGKRIDHELANILLLVHPRLATVEVKIVAGNQELTLVRGEARFRGDVGDLLSLLPIGGDARGVTTWGLEYPLNDEPLYFGPARGVSNVFTTTEPIVRVREGLLLAVHTRRPG